MRKILFRGKRADNGEWVYGYYTKHTSGRIFIRCISKDCTQSYEVIPSSVGEYTSVKDKDVNKIFEGDIVKIQVTNDRYVNLEVSFFEGKYILINKHLQHWKLFRCYLSNSLKPKIIGNIHDNPKLLEVE